MRKKLFLLTTTLLFSVFTLTAFAQTTVKPTLINGDVVSITTEKIVLKTATGEVEATLSDKTKYLRVLPENPSPSAATPSSFSDIGVGDKVIISVVVPEDKKTMPVRTVYLMSKADISQRLNKDKEDWKTRGTVGKVKSFNPQTNVITITVGGMMGSRELQVTPKEKAEFYRYAADSIEFSKAVKSKISEVEPGDEIRVLGDKNAENTEIKAEKIVTGAFRTNAGTIKAIDVEKNEIIITDSQTKKDVAVKIEDFSILKQFPAEMAQRMVQMQSGGGGGGFRPPTQGGGQTTPQPNPQTNPQPNPQTNPQTPGQGGGFRGAGGGLDDSRFQNIKVADLKVGEMIGVLSSKNPDPTRIKAIKLFSGVEPFIKLAQMTPTRQGGGGGGGASLNIPGLDGFGGN